MVKKLLLSVVFISSAFICYSQNKCDCSITPYKPDSCFKQCAGGVLKNSTELDLKLVLGLKDDVAEKILRLNISSDSSALTLDKYLSQFDQKDQKTVLGALKSLNQEQVKYLEKPVSERKIIMAQMEQMQLFKKG